MTGRAHVSRPEPANSAPDGHTGKARAKPQDTVTDDTRTDPALLGRALLDRYGGLWLLVGEEQRYRCGVVTPSCRDQFEADRGPVREVMLVSPAAVRVLDAARDLAAAARANVKLPIMGTLDRAQRLQDAEREVCAAVDTLEAPADPTQRTMTPMAHPGVGDGVR